MHLWCTCGAPVMHSPRRRRAVVAVVPSSSCRRRRAVVAPSSCCRRALTPAPGAGCPHLVPSLGALTPPRGARCPHWVPSLGALTRCSHSPEVPSLGALTPPSLRHWVPSLGRCPHQVPSPGALCCTGFPRRCQPDCQPSRVVASSSHRCTYHAPILHPASSSSPRRRRPSR